MIKTDLSKCTGCRSCEVACGFFHSGKVGLDVSRIRVTHNFETGIDGPVVCAQCSEGYCLKCPEKALQRRSTGEVVCSPSLCTACKECEDACPIGAIEVVGEFALICDLCGGSPRCVEACSEGAIEFVPGEFQTTSLKAIRKQTREMNSSQKRRHYIETEGKPITEKWMGKNA